MRSLLRRVGIEVPDTRAWRLEQVRDAHPLVDALLAWRKAERIATTYGYGWLDEHVGADGRLRGQWSASDGAAGRMTASAGLHNMPADLRPAVVAEPGHVFVRADLGQIEPRVLAAVSGDAALGRGDPRPTTCTRRWPTQLGVDRPTAKVAVLGRDVRPDHRPRRPGAAPAGGGLPGGDGLPRTTPTSPARSGATCAPYGGRLVRMGTTNANEVSDRDARRRAAARGRYARNAMVQGAAAELFKMWAVTVRARGAELGARIVLCLHDELLVHVPAADGDDAARLVDDCLQEAARRWAPDDAVRFVADIRRPSSAGPTPSRDALGRRARRSPACASTTTGSGSRSPSTDRRTGRPSLLLHGISGSTATYDFLVPELPGHRLLPARLPGPRALRPGARRTTVIDGFASDATAVLEQVVGGPAVVVGHSLGGVTAAVRGPACGPTS